METDLTKRDSHFAFGDNWSAYSNLIDEQRIVAAQSELARLLGRGDLSGKSILDIGSGSGIHSLAGLRLGAHSVLAIDIDSQSVATTRETLSRFAPTKSWEAREASVFELRPSEIGQFDIVYSWGVLHHTGNLHEALACASNLVAPGGSLALALYYRTLMDWFWKPAKRWYAQASPRSQAWARRIYTCALMSDLLVTGRSPWAYRREYFKLRGMSMDHDIHDWLGGWPYESISANELSARLKTLGFEFERGSDHAKKRFRSTGIFGSGCSEYVYKRIS